jgi:hypothetical protein
MARKRTKAAPKYVVNISLNAWDIAKAGAAARLKVSDRNGLLGTIEIGQGTFGWKSARGKKGFKRFSWSKLAAKLDLWARQNRSVAVMYAAWLRRTVVRLRQGRLGRLTMYLATGRLGVFDAELLECAN